MTTRTLSLGLALVAALAVAAVAYVRAQQPAQDPVLARVDGVEIKQSDLALAEADIGSNLPPTTGDARRDQLLSFMIDVTILAKAAEAQKLGDGAEFAQKLAYARRKALMEALLDTTSKNAATDAAMKQLYDDSVKKLTPEKEVRARHILVETEDKAKEIVAKLKAGGDFIALAKENSKDPGAPEGGDLGYFAKSQMVPEFAEAAFKLEKGQISDPVKTQFGWHVIKLEDARDRPVPPFDTVKDQIANFIVQRAQAELVMKLREGAKIEKLTPAPATPAPAPAPAAPAPADKK
jgi:peptidyl-prolyl cis-trans isomerase C